MSYLLDPASDRAVLVIDDGEIKRYMTCRILEQAGLKVAQAVTGSQGLAMARENPRLIVLDVKLPDIDGFEVCRRLKADPATASIPVLHLSAHRTTGTDKAHGLDDGADAYLTLPVEPEVLVATVRALLRIQQAEESARASARHWQATFDAISDAVFLTDSEGVVTRSNAAANLLVSAAGDPLTGETLIHLLDDLGLSSLSTRIISVLDGDCLVSDAVESANEERWLRVRMSPIQESGGGIVCTLADVTARIEAERERAKIALRNERIAETLQRTLLLTPDVAIFSGLEIEQRYEAASKESLIGGDFSDVIGLPGNLVALVVGDVTGKGLEAAAFTAEIKFVLRAFLRESSDPTIALARLNSYLLDGKELNSATPGAFVSLSLSIVDVEGERVISSSAGAEPPLLLRGGSRPGIELAASGPLVAIDADSKYQQIEASFLPGDLMVIATDGITEARRKNEFFGLEGIERAVLEAGVGGRLRETANTIVRSALAFANGHQKDDICLIVVRRKGPMEA